MTYWVGTSWKMNKTLAEALAFAEALAAFVAGARRPHPALRHPLLHRRPRGEARRSRATRVKVGAQNMHWADAGAWTGEVSPRHAQGLRARPGRARPQRAPRAFRRDRRDRRPEDRGRRPPRLRAADLRRRDAGRARGRPRRRGADRADRGRAASSSTRASAPRRSSSPTSRSGRSARRASPPPPTMPTGSRR